MCQPTATAGSPGTRYAARAAPAPRRPTTTNGRLYYPTPMALTRPTHPKPSSVEIAARWRRRPKCARCWRRSAEALMLCIVACSALGMLDDADDDKRAMSTAALSSFRRWPSDRPSFSRSVSLSAGRMSRSMSFARRVGASAAKPRGVSHFSSSSKAPPSPVVAITPAIPPCAGPRSSGRSLPVAGLERNSRDLKCAT
jgi:hypothetical protein